MKKYRKEGFSCEPMLSIRVRYIVRLLVNFQNGGFQKGTKRHVLSPVLYTCQWSQHAKVNPFNNLQLTIMLF